MYINSKSILLIYSIQKCSSKTEFKQSLTTNQYNNSILSKVNNGSFQSIYTCCNFKSSAFCMFFPFRLVAGGIYMNTQRRNSKIDNTKCIPAIIRNIRENSQNTKSRFINHLCHVESHGKEKQRKRSSCSKECAGG